MNKLSVTIITLNEEENIAKCLNSVKEIANEIILVDSGSNDQTVKIAESLNAKTYFRRFDNFANQKNYALSLTSGDYIFSIDADEVVTPELAKEIKEVIQEERYNGFFIRRRNYILGGEIKYSRWSPDKHIWLWKRNFGEWVGEVHEEVIVQGNVGELKNAKIHYQDKTILEFIVTNKRYADLMVYKLYKQKIKFSLIRLIWDPFFEFSIRYFYKKGFLDGWRGFVLAILMAFYKIDVWLKLLKLSRKNKK